jgi:hypothetical protein
MNAALIAAVIGELDLQDIICLTLLSKKGFHDSASALADVVDPILVDEPLQRHRLALSVGPFERCARVT